MRALRHYSCFAAFLILIALAGPRTRAATLDELAEMGEEAMKAGNYEKAIEHYKQITEIGKTYESLLAVQFDLAWCYYLTGQPEEAIPLFEHLSSKRAPSEGVKQQSLFLLAECYARSAGQKPEDSAERQKAATTSIELHTKFQKEYPANPNVIQSLYGRAYAYFLNKDMEKAEVDLKKVIELQPRTPTARDATFLLASVYSAQGLEKLKAGDRAGSQEFTDKARALFAELSRGEGTNLGTANDSIFSLAETWFAAGEYLQAISYYQQIRSKLEVARNVKRLQDHFYRQFTEQLRNNQDTTMSRAAVDKLRSQVREIEKAPDMMISGYFKIAEAFFQLERYDELRTVCRHLMNFVDDEKEQQAQYMVIISYLKENDAEAAAAELESFQESFGYDLSLVDTVAMSIGQIYLTRGDMEKAREFFNKSAAEHTEGRSIQEALYLKFAAEYMDGDNEKTLASIAEYMDKFPKGKYIPNAMYYKAMCLAAQKQWDGALATINAVLDRFPKGTEDFTSIDEAFYQKGWMLNEMQRSAQAAAHIEEFLTRFPQSQLRPEALYQLGIALNASGEPDKAKAVLEGLAGEFPDNTIAPIALYQIAVMYFEKKDFPEMEKALLPLIKKYPDNPIVVEARFWLGWIANSEERYDEAVEQLTECVKLNPQHNLAPECILMIARAHQSKAKKLGLPTVLTEEQRAVYKAGVLKTAATFEALMEQYPQSRQMLDSVPGIAESIHDLFRYRQMNEKEAIGYFTSAIARHSGDSNTSALLYYSMGSFLMKIREQEKALDAFKKSLEINPSVRLSPVMLNEYADALKEAGSLEKAEAIYTKIIADYEDDPLVLAPAWYGLADIKYRENNFEEAKTLFEKVLVDFDWYEEGKQGRVMLARILEQREQYAEAEKMFEQVWQQEKGVTRLGAMLGVARCQLAQAEIAKKEGQSVAWKENIGVADRNLTRIIVLFEAYPESVSEALWLKGNAYELVGDTLKARETYSRLVLEDEYKSFPWAAKAREQLNKIGGILAPAAAAP